MGDSVFDATGGCNYICMYQRENPNVWDSKMKIAFCPQIISPRFSNAKSAKPPNITSCVTFSQEEKMAIVGFDNGELGQINLTQGSYRCSPAGDILFREPIVSISIGSSATTDANRVAYIVQSGKVVLLEIIDDEYRICTDNTFNNVEDRFHRVEGFQFKCTVQFDPINFDLLLIKHDNHVYLYDCILNDVIEEIELPYITTATFSRSGDGIALATLDGQLHVHKIVGNKFRDGKKYKWSEATQKEEYVTSIAPMFTNSSERYFVGTCGGRGTGSLYIIECK
jgi:hypothetical protein